MVVQIKIEDEKIENLSSEAKKSLKQQVETYAEYIIKESNLIEEGNREDGADREITSSIILQAARKYKNTLPKKKDKWLVVIKIVSVFSLLITGFLFDADGYQDNIGKLIWFIIMIIIASASTVLQFVKEEWICNYIIMKIKLKNI